MDENQNKKRLEYLYQQKEEIEKEIRILEDYFSEKDKTSKTRDRGTPAILTQYYKEVKNIKRISKEEEKELFKEVKKGSIEAKNKIIENNLRLVIFIAKKYDNGKIDLLDLIQEGNIGLSKAVEKYDPNSECSFSTYAWYWITQKIIRAFSKQGNVITIPTNINNEIGKMLNAEKELEQTLLRKPTDDELAEKLNISRNELSLLKQNSQPQSSLDEIVKTDSIADDYKDEDIEDESSDYLKNQIVDEDIDVEQNAITSLTSEKLIELMNQNLTEREKDILTLRYGLDGNGAKDLSEVGKIFGITSERVRQVERKAITKLRFPSVKNKLK